MRALAYCGPSDVRVVGKPDPVLQDPGDAIVRVTRSAICGSDLHLYHGLVPDTRIGSTFGHEFTGVVERVGPEVRTLEPGDRVVVPFNIACGACFFCQRRRYASCDRSNPASAVFGGAFGYSHATGGYDGGQAEFVRVPFADVGPLKIPGGMAEEDVLFLSDILPTGFQAAEMAEIEPGETVAVFGCGPVGLFAQKSAWLRGAARVIAIDGIEYRLEFARHFSGAETVNFRSVPDVVTHLKDLTGGRGPDACIDAVGLEAGGSWMQRALGALRLQAGAATALAWAIEAVRKAGRVSIIGVYGPPWNLVPVGMAMNKGLTVRAGQCDVRRYMDELLGYIRSGCIDPRAVITHRLPLEEAPEAYRLFAEKRDGCIKCVLVPHGAGPS
jgi:threonine dehydrogenase-like Zn-dependent dehydrogenase